MKAPPTIVSLAQVMAPNRKIFALKRIKLQGKDSEASKGFVDEITLLQRLRGKQNIIQLVDAEVCVSLACADTDKLFFSYRMRRKPCTCTLYHVYVPEHLNLLCNT